MLRYIFITILILVSFATNLVWFVSSQRDFHIWSNYKQPPQINIWSVSINSESLVIRKWRDGGGLTRGNDESFRIAGLEYVRTCSCINGHNQKSCSKNNFTSRAVKIPLSLLTILLYAFLGITYLRSKRRREHKEEIRRLKNLCISCSYNLTGNISGICPECGTSIENANKILANP